jgi:hypothetical protein
VSQLSPRGGIYRGEWDLHRPGEVGLAAGGGQPGGVASTNSAFFSPCRCVANKEQVEPAQTLAGWPLGPLGLGSGPLGPCVKCTPVVMMILTFGQLHFVIP